MTIEQKTALIDCHCPVTLNGRQAKISGRLAPFATVWQLDRPAMAFPFAWDTVAYVVNNCSGAFQVPV